MPFLLLFLIFAWALCGQVASSTLLGTVHDESGAVVPQVRITAKHAHTGFSRIVYTGPAGVYRMDELQPGTYVVTAERQGFRSVEAPAVLLEVNQKAELNFELKVGRERDSVTVTTGVSRLEAEDPSVGYRLNSSQITTLPLATRNAIALVTLGPGAIPRQLGGFTHDVINDLQEARGAVALNPPINGARSTMNRYLLDGAYNTDGNTFAIAVTPSMESVQEFRIQTSVSSAEFAQGGGGLVDIVTKSGGLAYHGSALEFFRNEALDARNFFDDPKLPRPIFRQNQFGGSLGGSLPLPSTFFFVSYEGLKNKSAKSSLKTVPDAAIRSGDFSGRNPIFDPLTIDPATAARRPFPGNRVPTDRIDPIASKFLSQYEPLPNRTGLSSNYLDATPSDSTNNTVSGRIDHEFRDYSRLFGRYSINEDRGAFASNFPVRPTSERTRAQQAAVGETTGGSVWLNEARLSFTRLRVFDVPRSAFGQDVAKDLGVTGLSSDPFTFGLPLFEITNFSTVTDSPLLPQVQRDNFWSLSDGLSYTRGHHTWKTGFNWLHFQFNYLQSQLARGHYIFSGAFTGLPGQPKTGAAFADFLLGFPQVTSRQVGTTQAYMRQDSYAGYFQDDWHVTRNLTLNLGLRYEYTAPYTEARNNLLNLDYSTLPKPPRLVRVSNAVEPDRKNLAPRAGLALRLPHDSALRAGYGIFYSPEIAVETYDLILNGIRSERNESDGTVPILTTRDGFPRTASTGFPTYFGLDLHARTPYVQQWTASFQHEFRGHILFEIAYLGTKGTRLGRFRTFNTPQHVETGENLAPRPGDLQSLRPFPELGQIIQRQNIANSLYHSLQMKAEKRLVRRLSFLASFVWAKSIDDADSVVPGLFDSFGAQDERNLRLERGLSFFDVRRRVSAGFDYELPRAGLLRAVLSNWQVGGIITLQDGTPLNPVYFAFDPANSGTPNRPDVVPGQRILLPGSQRTADHWYNPGAFIEPKPYTFGNAGRNILPGPGNSVFDLALHRRFRLAESRRIELRSEFLNAFNHPNFGIPDPYPDNGPFFGRIFSTGEPRRIQLALRFDF